MCSELCCELGSYYSELGDINEARLWYYNALNETEPVMNIKYGGEIPQDALTVLDDMV